MNNEHKAVTHTCKHTQTLGKYIIQYDNIIITAYYNRFKCLYRLEYCILQCRKHFLRNVFFIVLFIKFVNETPCAKKA